MMASLKSEMATKSELATLRSELTTEIKSLRDGINGRFDSLAVEIESLHPDFKSSFDKFDFKSSFDKFRRDEAFERENRFWMILPVSGLLCIHYILPSNNIKFGIGAVVVIGGLLYQVRVLQEQMIER
jgi:hypothetical protein